jgi:hypothetical protein
MGIRPKLSGRESKGKSQASPRSGSSCTDLLSFIYHFSRLWPQIYLEKKKIQSRVRRNSKNQSISVLMNNNTDTQTHTHTHTHAQILHIFL